MSYRLEYQLNEDDLVQYHMWFLARLVHHQTQLRRARVTWFVMLLGLTGFYAFLIGYVAGVVVLIVGLALLVLLSMHRKRRSSKNLAAIIRETADDILAKPIVLELRDDGLWSESATGRSTYFYQSIGSIVETPDHFFVPIGKGQAHIIPRDWLQQGAIDAFVAELKRRCEAAKASADRAVGSDAP